MSYEAHNELTDLEQVDPFNVNTPIIWRTLYKIWNHMRIFKNLIICGDLLYSKNIYKHMWTDTSVHTC
jgi:hypothetical protein